MPIDPSAVGASGGPVRRSWDSKDCLLYALTTVIWVDGQTCRFQTRNDGGEVVIDQGKLLST